MHTVKKYLSLKSLVEGFKENRYVMIAAQKTLHYQFLHACFMKTLTC